MLPVGCTHATLPQQWYRASGSSMQGYTGPSSRPVHPSLCVCPLLRVRLSDLMLCFPGKCASVCLMPPPRVYPLVGCLSSGGFDSSCTSLRTGTLPWLGPPSPQRVPFWVREGGSGLAGVGSAF